MMDATEQAMEYFRAVIEHGRLAQAYVVVGPPKGEGQAFAEAALSLVMCREKDKPCGRCRDCVQIRSHQHPDVLWIEPEKKSRVISVGQMRDLQQRVYQTSYAGGWKAGVIMGADRMQGPAANAFLKTLEEPPEQTLFLLLTDTPQFLLPTISSRCQRLTVSSDQVALAPEWQDLLRTLLKNAADGTMAAAVARADGMEKLFALMKGAAAQEEAERGGAEGEPADDETVDARIGARYRGYRTGAMQFLLRWYRDLLVVVCGGDEANLHEPEERAWFQQRAAGIRYREAIRNVAIVETMNRQMEGNVPEGALLIQGFTHLS